MEVEIRSLDFPGSRDPCTIVASIMNKVDWHSNKNQSSIREVLMPYVLPLVLSLVLRLRYDLSRS